MLARVSKFSFFPALQVKLNIYDKMTYSIYKTGLVNGYL